MALWCPLRMPLSLFTRETEGERKKKDSVNNRHSALFATRHTRGRRCPQRATNPSTPPACTTQSTETRQASHTSTQATGQVPTLHQLTAPMYAPQRTALRRVKQPSRCRRPPGVCPAAVVLTVSFRLRGAVDHGPGGSPGAVRKEWHHAEEAMHWPPYLSTPLHTAARLTPARMVVAMPWGGFHTDRQTDRHTHTL